ncbi:MAG: DoxX family protein [Ignavibacteria bacterium]|nr:DoxX family protein [Ignavibacteria bacterium]
MTRIKNILLYVMSALYILAGIMHFVNPGFYTAIMPPWLPWHLELVYISGVCESLLGLLLLPRRTRRMAAWGIIALLVAVFPANIQMMINYVNTNNPDLWIAIVRLPLQLVLIWWAWLYTKKLQ